jgi:hypothetical protein
MIFQPFMHVRRVRGVPALPLRTSLVAIATTLTFCIALVAQTNTFPSSGNVGIGTLTPGATLQVVGSGQAINSVSNGGAGAVKYSFVGYAVGSGAIANTGIYAYASGGSSNYGVRIVSPNSGANNFAIYADATAPSYFAGNVGIGAGATNPVHPLQVAGTIGAQEVIVSSTGADYVFAPNYYLKPLTEVARYIEANHHLPDIPSADEVKQKGIGVGEMESKLLAKIEELTLHMIRSEERNDRLERENHELREAVQDIKERIKQ